MKKTLPVLLAALFLLSTPIARAEHGWGLFGSYWDTSDVGGAPGLGLCLGAEILPHTLLDFRISYFDGFSAEGNGAELEMSATPFEFGLLIQSDDNKPVQFSAGLGGGYYSVSAEVVSGGTVIGDPDIDSQMGFYMLGGAEYAFTRDVESINATRATLFGEVMYRSVELDRVQTGGGSLVINEGNMSGLGVNIGLKLRW